MQSTVLRILDANCNRAREALRVMEDYARFVLDDASLCADLKQLRHDFVDTTQSVSGDAILHRDLPGDVGTDIKTVAETRREDLAHVVVAAGKRLAESLRAIGEYLKVDDAARALSIEQMRYRGYDLEARLARTFPSMRGRCASVRLYVLITESLCAKPWLQVAAEAIEGGADCLQLREKDLESAELLRRARQLVTLCREHQVISIINDRPDIAVLSSADGVHVGQDDLPAHEVRKLIGSDKIVGVSTHNIEQARQAILDGASYIGAGPIYRSVTKPREILPGLEFARQVADELSVKTRAVAIAGINQNNVDEVLSTGIRAIAVSSAVISQHDVRAAAAALKEKLILETDVRICR